MKKLIVRIYSCAAVFVLFGSADLYAATCEPAGSVAALISCISGASSGDVIDLGGFTYHLSAVDNTSANGENGLPIITIPLTIKNGAIDRIYFFAPFRIFEINAGGNLILNGVKLTNGATVSPCPVLGTCNGGAILVSGGELSIEECTFDTNEASSSGGALAIQMGGIVSTINNSIFQSNQTTGTNGGGIAILDGSIGTIHGSTFKSNRGSNGGAITLIEGSIGTISNSIFSDNTSNEGAAIAATSSSNATISTISDSIFTKNLAFFGGALFFVNGTISTIDRCTFSENYGIGAGGGIYAATSTISTISNSTFDNNVAQGSGGAIELVDCTMEILENSTFNKNISAFGGAISFSNICTLNNLSNSTIVGNTSSTSGGGIGLGNGSTISNLVSTIVAQNTANNSPDIVAFGTIGAASFNLIGDGSGSGLIDGVDNNQVGTSLSPINPRVKDLANNGGPTMTMALVPDSPAVDKGSNPLSLPWDQRGQGFPRTDAFSGLTDVGAFETEGKKPVGRRRHGGGGRTYGPLLLPPVPLPPLASPILPVPEEPLVSPPVIEEVAPKSDAGQAETKVADESAIEAQGCSELDGSNFRGMTWPLLALLISLLPSYYRRRSRSRYLKI